MAGLLLGLMAAGAADFALASWQASRIAPPQEPPRVATILTGEVAEVALLPEGRRVTLRAARFDAGPVEERLVRLRLKSGDPSRPQPGDRLKVRAMVRPPGAPSHPGGWDFQRAA